jgi:hypothetical protein
VEELSWGGFHAKGAKSAKGDGLYGPDGKDTMNKMRQDGGVEEWSSGCGGRANEGDSREGFEGGGVEELSWGGFHAKGAKSAKGDGLYGPDGKDTMNKMRQDGGSRKGGEEREGGRKGFCSAYIGGAEWSLRWIPSKGRLLN